MPALPFTRALAANETNFNPFDGWEYDRVPWQRAAIKLLTRATAVGVVMRVKSGSMDIQPRSPVQAGGTAGVTPSELNTPALIFFAGYNDKLRLEIDNTTAGAITVDGIVFIEPA